TATDALALVPTSGTPATYLHSGPDGSTFAATNDGGALIEAYTYTAFGETRFWDPATGSVPASVVDNRYLFQGQYYEPGLGLYLMGARPYKPEWGRFLSPDPAGIAGGLNLFAFVGGRPLTFSDPSGLGSQPSANRFSRWATSVLGGFEIGQKWNDRVAGFGDALLAPLVFLADVDWYTKT